MGRYRTTKEERMGFYTHRKDSPGSEDYERYADIITAYRELLRLSALDDDIRIGQHGRCTVPTDREDLLEWVRMPKNLDLVAESFRRVCSGYVSTGRLFAVCSGPIYHDWLTILSMLRTSEEVLYNASVFVEISGRDCTEEEVIRLRDARDKISEVRGRLGEMYEAGELPRCYPRPISDKLGDSKRSDRPASARGSGSREYAEH